MSSGWLEDLDGDLAEADAQSLRRRLRAFDEPDGAHITCNGRRVLNLCHNDYLGLSREPALIEAAIAATRRWGTGAAASRLITGNHRVVADLEERLAEFKHASSALVFPTGYQASLGVLGALASKDDCIALDRLAHACLAEGSRLSGARLRVWRRDDLDKLDDMLADAADARRRFIVTDGVTSMDGDIVNLPELLAIAEHRDAIVVVDDAHATGTIGERGRGTAEHWGIDPHAWEHRLVVVATLSKALGTQGGVVLGAAAVRDTMVQAARSFIYTTGLAPAMAAAAHASIDLVDREPQRVLALQQRSAAARAFFAERGLSTANSQTPILPLMMPSSEVAIRAAEALLERGVLVLAIRPPTVPKGTSRLRLTINLLADEDDTRAALEEIARMCRAMASNEGAM